MFSTDPSTMTARNCQPAVRAELTLRAVGVKAEAQRDRAQRGALTPTSTGPRLAAAGGQSSERFADAPTTILRERWRSSSLPSVPSALRGLDLHQSLPLSGIYRSV